MYARDLADQPEPLAFGVSGKLIMNVLVMYDRQTGTLWSQILGKGVQGPLAGVELTPLPALQTTWSQWRDLHPETLALDKGFPGARDPYDSYYNSNRAGVLGETLRDDRLPTKALGLGLLVDGQPAYYPFSVLADQQVANDMVAGQHLLVIYEADVQTASAFSAVAGGQGLTFSAEPGRVGRPLTLVDAETGSRWNAFGAAIDGPLAGTTLERWPATTSFWFGWKDWHPDTHVYGVERAGP